MSEGKKQREERRREAAKWRVIKCKHASTLVTCVCVCVCVCSAVGGGCLRWWWAPKAKHSRGRDHRPPAVRHSCVHSGRIQVRTNTQCKGHSTVHFVQTSCRLLVSSTRCSTPGKSLQGSASESYKNGVCDVWIDDTLKIQHMLAEVWLQIFTAAVKYSRMALLRRCLKTIQ